MLWMAPLTLQCSLCILQEGIVKGVRAEYVDAGKTQHLQIEKELTFQVKDFCIGNGNIFTLD